MFIALRKSKEGDDVVSLNSKQLWMGIREGKKEALTDLFCKYYELLYNYGYNIIPQKELVKDSIQELFLTLWEKHGKIQEAQSVKLYLMSSLRRNLLRNLQKQKSRYQRNRTYIENQFEDALNMEELVIHAEVKNQQQYDLEKAIDRLSKKQKEAIYLKFFDGLSSSEIAYVMGINKQSVYNHISEAITRIQVLV